MLLMLPILYIPTLLFIPQPNRRSIFLFLSTLILPYSTFIPRQLISTLPLDVTLPWVGRKDLAERLTYSSTHVIGLGLRGRNPHHTKCWLYYPEDDCPFYRCTVFSHYAKGNTPGDDVLLPTLRLAATDPEVLDKDGSASPGSAVGQVKSGPYWSLMFEVSESAMKPVDLRTIVEVRSE